MKKFALLLAYVVVLSSVALFCSASSVLAESLVLMPGYVRIDNYAGFRTGGAWWPPEEPREPFWIGFYGIPDFEYGTDPDLYHSYVDYNTEAIGASIRTTSYYYEERSLWFETGGVAVIDDSYCGLWSTDFTCDGHVYTKAVFDWTAELDYAAAACLSLELWAGYPGNAGRTRVWAVQPGQGSHSGHVEVEFPASYNIAFRLVAVNPEPLPEPTGITTLLLGVICLLARRRQ